MEVFALIAIPLLFVVTLYILIYKKDEKFLLALEERTRLHQQEIKQLQDQINSVYGKLQGIDLFCQALKIDFSDKKSDWDNRSPVPLDARVAKIQDESLSKLQNDITTIKEILNLGDESPF